jgi:hypothetical protein
MSLPVLRFSIITGTAVFFLVIKSFNGWMIEHLNFFTGIGWISLPDGVCILSTLLFGILGVVGVLIADLLLNVFHSGLTDLDSGIMDAMVKAAGPYLVYLFATRAYDMKTSLAKLTSKRLLLLIVLCALACSALQSSWMALHGNVGNLPLDFMLMFAGNLSGALILTYTIKFVLATFP